MHPTQQEIQQILDHIEDRPPGISAEQFREAAPCLAAFEPFRGTRIESFEVWTDSGNGESHLVVNTDRGSFGFVAERLGYSSAPLSEGRAREITSWTKDDVRRILDNAVYG